MCTPRTYRRGTLIGTRCVMPSVQCPRCPQPLVTKPPSLPPVCRPIRLGLRRLHPHHTQRRYVPALSKPPYGRISLTIPAPPLPLPSTTLYTRSPPRPLRSPGERRDAHPRHHLAPLQPRLGPHLPRAARLARLLARVLALPYGHRRGRGAQRHEGGPELHPRPAARPPRGLRDRERDEQVRARGALEARRRARGRQQWLGRGWARG